MQKNLYKKAVVLGIILLTSMCVNPMISAIDITKQKDITLELFGRGNETIPPVANFTYTPIDIKTGEQVTFNSTSYDSDGYIVNWTWSFGDGNFAYEENVTHTYSDDGTYTINLTVMDNSSLNASIEKIVTVTNQDIPPVADFTYTPIDIKTGEQVTFISTSYDSDGYIVNWTWSFGDGNFAYEENVTHTYWDDGTYTINLTVMDNSNLKASMEKIVTLTNQEPTADFTFTPEYPFVDDFIYFTDESTDIDGDIVSWWWSFGDGYFSEVQNPKHSYGALGNYTVNLTITDDDGAINTVEKIVPILEENEAPDPPIITGPDIVRADQAVDFVFQSKDPNDDDVKYIVTWGDGGIDETDYYLSDEPASVNHTWNKTLMPVMILRMTVLAEDVYGSRSLLVEKWIFVIAMKSVNYDPNEEPRPFNLILSRIIQRISNAFPILQRILNRIV